MKLLLVGGYSYQNPGDDAILKSTVYFLNELYPSATFYIWTNSPDFSVQFDRPIQHEVVYWQPLVTIQRESIFSHALIKLYTDFYPFSKWLIRALNGFDKDFVNLLRECDKVICVGGGYLNSNFNLLEMNYMFSLASRYGKPVFLLGQTLGPFKKKSHRRMANEIFKGAQKIVLRDTDSLNEILDYTDKTWHGTDDAVAFSPRITEADEQIVSRYFSRIDGKPTLFFGISLRCWCNSREYYVKIAAAIESFAKSCPGHTIKLIFIPMEASRYCDDRHESAFFSKHLSPAVDYVMAEEDLTTEQKFHLISRLDLLIGMRLHSLVFALSNGIPAIGLYHTPYYNRKISGLFESFHFKKNILTFDELWNLESLIRENVTNRLALGHFLQRKKTRLVQRQHLFLKELMKQSDLENSQVYSENIQENLGSGQDLPEGMSLIDRFPLGREQK